MRKRVLLTVVALLTATLTTAAPVLAGDTQCVGLLTGAHDNVVVPEGAFCTLQGAVVRGNVKVLRDARLQANASTIGGNVEGDNARGVLLQFSSSVGGNFQVKGGAPFNVSGFDINVRVGGDAKVEENRGTTFIDAATVGGNIEVIKSTGFIEVEFNTVGGNIKVEDNSPTGMTVLGNRVEGNMQIFKNRGAFVKQVVFNRIEQDLQCFENDPPFLGGPNVANKAEGQCFLGPLPPGF